MTIVESIMLALAKKYNHKNIVAHLITKIEAQTLETINYFISFVEVMIVGTKVIPINTKLVQRLTLGRALIVDWEN